MSPHQWALPTIKHDVKFITNQTFLDHKVYEWEGSYAYSSIVESSHTYNKTPIKHLEKICKCIWRAPLNPSISLLKNGGDIMPTPQ
jgi:hypothetical protein